MEAEVLYGGNVGLVSMEGQEDGWVLVGGMTALVLSGKKRGGTGVQ